METDEASICYSDSMEFIKTETADESSTNITQAADIKSKIAHGEFKTFRRHGKSRVWDVFAGITDANGIEVEGYVTCIKCTNIFKFTKNSSSNLLKHKCYICYISQELRGDAVEVSDQTKKKCLTAVTEWAIENSRSFKIIEDSGFRKVAQFLISVGIEYGKTVNLDSLFAPPSTLSSNVDMLYDMYFNKIMVEIGEIKECGFGVTTDVWTDDYLKHSFLAVTIHYVMGGELKNRLLAFRSVECVNPTGEHIKFEVSQTLADFNSELNDKVVIVTDNSVNMTSAFRLYNHIYCINHLLNNAVENAITETPEVTELRNICSKLVKYLKKVSISSSLETTLKSFSPTPWNSCFYLLSLVADNWLEITSILKEKKEMYRIGNINLRSLEAVVKVLRSFEESTKMMEGDNYATLHWVYMYIHRLKKNCDIGLKHNFSDAEEVANALREKLSHYLNEIVIKNIHLYHKIALFLFPPTNKLKQFTESEKNLIKMECRSLMRSYADSIKDETDQKPSTLNISSFNSDLLSDFVEDSASLNVENKVDHEIRLYENIDVEFHDDFNILQWWNSHKSEFPLLYKVSCKLLATPASSAASGRAFSMAKSLISEKSSGIGSDLDTVNKIMFLHRSINKTNLSSEVKNICMYY